MPRGRKTIKKPEKRNRVLDLRRDQAELSFLMNEVIFPTKERNLHTKVVEQCLKEKGPINWAKVNPSITFLKKLRVHLEISNRAFAQFLRSGYKIKFPFGKKEEELVLFVKKMSDELNLLLEQIEVRRRKEQN